MKKYNIYRQRDGETETLYNSNPFTKEGVIKFFKTMKIIIKANDGYIIGESKDGLGFYARTCKYTRPFTMRAEIIIK